MINTILYKPDTYAPFVNTLYFAFHRGISFPPSHSISREMSIGLANILPLLTNLDYLSASEFWRLSAAIFARHEQITFQLSDFRLTGITFSSQERIMELYHFLSKQKNLRFLRLGLSPEPVPEVDYDALPAIEQDLILPSSLPVLTHYDGPFFLATKVIEAWAPLEYLRVRLSSEYNAARDSLEIIIAGLLDLKSLCESMVLANSGKTVKALTVIGIPDELELQDLQHAKDVPRMDSDDVPGKLMHLLAMKFPLLRHIAVLPLSCHDVSVV